MNAMCPPRLVITMATCDDASISLQGRAGEERITVKRYHKQHFPKMSSKSKWKWVTLCLQLHGRVFFPTISKSKRVSYSRKAQSDNNFRQHHLGIWPEQQYPSRLQPNEKVGIRWWHLLCSGEKISSAALRKSKGTFMARNRPRRLASV